MRISDWSSDVCSSDLGSRAMARTGAEAPDAAVGFFGRIRAFFTRDSDDEDGPTLHDREPSLRRGKANAVGGDSYVDPEDLGDDEIEDDDEAGLPRLPAAIRADESRVTRRIEKPKAGGRAAREAQTTLRQIGRAHV